MNWVTPPSGLLPTLIRRGTHPAAHRSAARSHCGSIIVVILATEALLTADRSTPIIAELFAPLFPPDLIPVPLPGRARINPHATGSDVNALCNSRNGGDTEQTGCDQCTCEEMLHDDPPVNGRTTFSAVNRSAPPLASATDWPRIEGPST